MACGVGGGGEVTQGHARGTLWSQDCSVSILWWQPHTSTCGINYIKLNTQTHAPMDARELGDTWIRSAGCTGAKTPVRRCLVRAYL